MGGASEVLALASPIIVSRSRSQTHYLPLPTTQGGKGLAHTNRASGSGLHWKAVEEIRPHSMNLIKNGMCRNIFSASESYITNEWGLLPHNELPYQ